LGSHNEGNADLTVLLRQAQGGDAAAMAALMNAIYGQLRHIAGAYMRRERSDHTLQATALVHEAYVRLVGQKEIQFEDRSHLFALAAKTMRRILVDHARAKNCGRRGGEMVRLPVEDVVLLAEARSAEFLELDEALDELAAVAKRKAEIVEMRFFAGMTEEEIAEVLGMSSRTVKRDWEFARGWLKTRLDGDRTQTAGAGQG
jgi:RNA polymerase sigma factor (TIGR02999 family)